MKRILYIVIVCALASVVASAQSRNSRNWSLGAGIRVGLGSMMQKSEEESSDRTNGFDGSAEGVFTYYFSQSKGNFPQFGFRTGLSLGFRQNTLTMDNIDHSYSVEDGQGNSILYHVTAEDVKETDRQFAVELPVMFATYYNRIYANIGFRVGIPLMSRYNQTMSDPVLTATYEKYGVTIEGERVTGKLTSEDINQKAKLDASTFNLCLSLEAGYTFDLIGGKLLAGMYADYGLVDNYKGKGEHFTDADPTTINGATNTPATVVVHSLTDSYVNNVGIFCMGIRAVYAWQFPRQRQIAKPVRSIFH